MKKFLGKTTSVFHEILSDTIHVDVYYIEASEERPYHTLVTQGMSNLQMNPPEGGEEYKYAELLMFLPKEWKISDVDFKDDRWYWPISWLKYLARFPHDLNSWLGFGHTIPNGDPPVGFSEDTTQSSMLLLPPINLNNGFWELSISDEKIIRFYCLVPIYNEELVYKLNNGLDALLDKFESNRVSMVVDLHRKNTCKKNFLFWKK